MDPVLHWYAGAARDLPWRRPGASPWAVLVSEVMLQQTPVARVLPAYEAWLSRWATPAALAAEPAGEAVRQWGRLGYPRRALRLHQSAHALVERHDGRVPADLDQLRALPGVGVYTAAAVASFAFGQRHAVVDTNVRRVLARAVEGAEGPAHAGTARELDLAGALVPEGARAPRWAVAVMELGALVCTARSPRCSSCPLRDRCAWQRAGRPPRDHPSGSSVPAARQGQAYAGTDRQVRGRLLEALRAATEALAAERLDSDAVWADPEQRRRCLRSLVQDGLVERLPDRRYRLPGA